MPPALVARLTQLPVAFQRILPDPIPELSTDNTLAVVVVPLQLFRSDAWPALRARLHRSSRFFLGWTPETHTADIVDYLRDGAYDVLCDSDADARWSDVLSQTAEAQALWVKLYGGRAMAAEDVLIGESEGMQRLKHTLGRLSGSDISVLILGESGVGKERVAQALHAAGGEGPFIAVNCAAIPRDLLEAELFGVEKGAFTGAQQARTGLVQRADGGTLFLDEIGEMDIGLQPKLLRFLETKTARKLGGEREYKVRFRVVAATNRNPEQAVAAGTFRMDLYYRLAEVVLQIPPLRSRTDDIPQLAMTFLSQANERFGKNISFIDPPLLDRFLAYPWPGNVRELKGVIDRLVLLHDGPLLRADYWDAPDRARMVTGAGGLSLTTSTQAPTAGAPVHAIPEQGGSVPVGSPESAAAGGNLPGRRERQTIARQLLASGQLSLSEVAARTGVHPTTLFRWRKAGTV